MPLRDLTVRVEADTSAAGRLCGRCRHLICSGPIIRVTRRGRSRGVVWCGECASPYLEVDR